MAKHEKNEKGHLGQEHGKNAGHPKHGAAHEKCTENETAAEHAKHSKHDKHDKSQCK